MFEKYYKTMESKFKNNYNLWVYVTFKTDNFWCISQKFNILMVGIINQCDEDTLIFFGSESWFDKIYFGKWLKAIHKGSQS
jgi:hypothetical protein